MALMTIDNSAIDVMRAAPELWRYIPCLSAPMQASVRARSCCDGGGSSGVDYNSIKLCLSGLDSANTQRVKDFFNATQIRFYRASTKNGSQITIKHTK